MQKFWPDGRASLFLWMASLFFAPAIHFPDDICRDGQVDLATGAQK
jgi:hypothetical protein